jgi:hypothetical protein
MPLQVACKCGKKISVNDDMAGDTIHCVRCGRKIDVPAPKPPPKPKPKPAPGTDAPAEPEAEAPAPPAPASSWRDSLYWLLAAASLPIAIMLGQPQGPGVKERIEVEIIKQGDDARRRLDELKDNEEDTLENLLALVPNRRLPGSYLPRDSQMHWWFALASTILFAFIVLSCFAPGSAEPLHLVLVGLFSGTVGVVLLLMAHSITALGAFVEFCLLEADNPKSDFFVVFFGFTFGVGLVEETVKFLPLIWYYRRYRTIAWRTACLWGMASGAGFGISEGVMYSTTFYNGIEPFMDYVVRFASCVASHAVWTALAGIALYRNQDLFQELFGRPPVEEMYRGPDHKPDEDEARNWSVLFGMALIRVLVGVMFLHGLDDAALTKDMYFLALLTDIASFAFLAWQIERCRREESPEMPEQKVEPAPD